MIIPWICYYTEDIFFPGTRRFHNNHIPVSNYVKKYFFVFIAFFFISACNYMEEKSAPHVKTLHTTERSKITTVAILPFTNKSEKKGADEVLRKCFFTNLSIKGYNLLKLEEIDERLKLASIDASNLDKEDIFKIGRIVKADALIYGTVTKCCKKYFCLYSHVTFGAELKMVDARSCTVIWQADHTERTHSDAIPVSPFSIPEAVIESSINVREKVFAETADRLVKKFLTSIPTKDFDSPINANVILVKSHGRSMGVYYRVQDGDTLSSISGKFYDATSKAKDISMSNNDVSDVTLKAGQELVIPDMPILNDIEDSQTIDRKRYKKSVYRVKWGDSFYKIATKVFDDGKRWTVIYHANKQEIKDIKDLPVGQVIIVPLAISKAGSW